MNKMPLEEHLATANDLAIVCHHLNLIYDRCSKYYSKNCKLLKMLRLLVPRTLLGTMVQIKSELDEDYHATIDDLKFKELGHIYYRLEEHYTTLQQQGVAIVAKQNCEIH